jgi:2OG-Fe(II) oxygenase superfamily
VTEHQKDVSLARMFDDWEGELIGVTRSSGFEVATKIAGELRKPVRAWANMLHIGADTYYHPDGFEDSDLTFLSYLNSEWGLNWGGETLFCDAAGEPDLAVRAKPNRGVIFPSKLLHRIAAPSRHADPWRYSFVVQFSATKERADEQT